MTPARRLASMFPVVFAAVASGGERDPLVAPRPTGPAAFRVPEGDLPQFVTCLRRGVGGELWAGTEDRGVMRWTPGGGEVGTGEGGGWSRYTAAHGLTDPRAYAVAVDGSGRVWAGLESDGVGTFDGRTWRTFGAATGPVGGRAFDLAVSPLDGAVWVAESAGLTRYDVAAGRWENRSPGVGPPGTRVFALAFAPDGRLYAGLATAGMAWADPADGYRTWRRVGPPAGDAARRAEFEPTGPGLPTGQINDVLVHSDGTVYAATPRGLAATSDRGATWTYTRGRDYAGKAEGRLGGPPAGWAAASGGGAARLLPEDYVTCLAEDAAGRLWVGFRRSGLLVRDAATGETREVAPAGDGKTGGPPDGFVTAILPDPPSRPWVGTYGGGVARLDLAGRLPGGDDGVDADVGAFIPHPPRGSHPSPAAPPTAEELYAAWAAEAAAAALAVERGAPWGVSLGGDWRTDGDWVGRYGRQFALLCAHGSPLDHTLVGTTLYAVDGLLGPHARPRDSRRMWLHELRWADRRVLYDPLIGYRRQGEWNDSGQSYPFDHEGPDLWVKFEAPPGLHRVSLYFFNKDGRRGKNRYRDYLLELRSGGEFALEDEGGDPLRQMPADCREATDVLAAARVREFWGGCHQRFAVAGPGRYFVRLARNDSYQALTCGVFLDRLTPGPPLPWAAGDTHPSTPTSNLGEATFDPPPRPDPRPLPPRSAAAALLLAVGEERPTAAALGRRRRLWTLALRGVEADRRAAAFAADPATAAALADLAARLRWRLGLWTPADRRSFDRAARLGWETGWGRAKDRADWPEARPPVPAG